MYLFIYLINYKYKLVDVIIDIWSKFLDTRLLDTAPDVSMLTVVAAPNISQSSIIIKLNFLCLN